MSESRLVVCDCNGVKEIVTIEKCTGKGCRVVQDVDTSVTVPSSPDVMVAYQLGDKKCLGTFAKCQGEGGTVIGVIVPRRVDQ